MVRIAISQAAFDAIASTLALGSVGFENATDEHGPLLPEAQQLHECSRVRHRQVKAPRHGLVGPVLAFRCFPRVDDREVRICGEVGIGLAEKFESGDFNDSRLKVPQVPCHLEDDDAIGRKTLGIGA
jgi:hypothetical protein